MKKHNVLIYPCGADNALELFESIKNSVHINVFGANSKKSVADIVFENGVEILPNVYENNFINSLNCLIDKYSIDFIFPTHDDVIYFLSQYTNTINCTIIGADRYINEICRFKRKTYDLFRQFNFCPSLFQSDSPEIPFPAFVKPNVGHGSVGAYKINKREDLNPQMFDENIICEYLPGAEYTVDCFSDQEGKLKYSFPRERKSIRNGVSHVNIEPSPDIIEKAFQIAQIINNKLNFKGLWFFQLKEAINGDLKLLEICPRIATTMAYARYKGVNLPLLTIFAYLGMAVEISIKHNKIELFRYSSTKAFYTFFYRNVYIDFDDTIIINDMVSLDAISFLYQCRNTNRNIFLITKHQENIYSTLEYYNLPKSLFKSIIVLSMTDLKYNYVSEPDSIFIDNHYMERQEVFEKLGIPVFDVEGIKSLIKII